MAPMLMLVVAFTLCVAYTVHTQCPSICDCNNYDSIKEIRCSSKGLTSIPNDIPADTQILRLELNQIESISSSDLSHLGYLTKLTLYNNLITFIDASAFEHQENLQVLNLKYNRIPSLHRETFRNTRKLKELSLDNNRLQSLENDTFRGLVKLNELEIDGNPLQSLPDGIFSSLSNLRLLDISNIVFEVFPSTLFDGLTGLETLQMNNVTQNGDELFGSEHIFYSVSKLTTLEVRHNLLRCIPVSFAVLRALTVLKLSFNPLTCTNFTGLKHLQLLKELHVEDSGLTRLTSNMFVGNPNLVFLLTEYSSLSIVEEDAFNGLGRLQNLYLSSNNLSTLPYNVFDSVPNNVTLDISNNPWDCDCNLRWLHTWLTTSFRGDIPDRFQPVCASPDRLVGQPIIDIGDSDYACMPETEMNDTVTHSVNEGENLVLKCSITGDPSPALHWLTPDHTELLPNTNQIPFSVDAECTLTIIRIRKEDAGTYSCAGTNAAGTLSVRNVVNVIGAGNGPVFTTASHLKSTAQSATATTHQSEPLPGVNNSSLVVSVAIVTVGFILIVVILTVVIIHRRNKSKNRPPNMADTMQHQPPESVPDLPPPHSTILPSSSEGIYHEIIYDDSLYDKPRGRMHRQDSYFSNGSCVVPAGYELSMIRDVGKQISQTSSTCGSACGADQPSKCAHSIHPEHNEQREGFPGLDPDAKVTYQNTRRERR